MIQQKKIAYVMAWTLMSVAAAPFVMASDNVSESVPVSTPSSSDASSASSDSKAIPAPEQPKELEPEDVDVSAAEKKKFDGMMRNFMRSPEGVKALHLAQTRAAFMEEENNHKLMQLFEDNKATLLNASQSIVWGNPKGAVKMVLVTDPLCPNCRVLSDILQRLVAKNPDVQIIVHQWAFVNPEESSKVARLMYAAYETNPKAYINLLGAVLNLKETPTSAQVEKLLAGAKLDVAKVSAAAASDVAMKRIEATRDLAKKLQFPGAPILMVVGPDNHLQLIPPLSEDVLIASMDELTAAIKAKK